MARSGLYSPIFGRLSSLGSPCAALFSCCGLSTLSTFLAWKLGYINFITLVSAAQVAGALTYISSFVSFIVFRLYYPDLERQSVSIVGIPGAVVGILLCILVIICILMTTKKQTIFIYSYIGSVLVLSVIYYYLVAENRQRFSDQERDILFTAHLMKGKPRVFENFCLKQLTVDFEYLAASTKSIRRKSALRSDKRTTKYHPDWYRSLSHNPYVGAPNTVKTSLKPNPAFELSRKIAPAPMQQTIQKCFEKSDDGRQSFDKAFEEQQPNCNLEDVHEFS